MLDRLTLAAVSHRSSFICRTTGRACALVAERAWTQTMRCCDDDTIRRTKLSGAPHRSRRRRAPEELRERNRDPQPQNRLRARNAESPSKIFGRFLARRPRSKRHVTRRQSRILFDRVVADRYVNQCSTLKSRDELVVFDRIDGDATVAQAQHAVMFRAVSGGGVPVWMQDPFKRWRVIM